MKVFQLEDGMRFFLLKDFFGSLSSFEYKFVIQNERRKWKSHQSFIKAFTVLFKQSGFLLSYIFNDFSPKTSSLEAKPDLKIHWNCIMVFICWKLNLRTYNLILSLSPSLPLSLSLSNSLTSNVCLELHLTLLFVSHEIFKTRILFTFSNDATLIFHVEQQKNFISSYFIGINIQVSICERVNERMNEWRKKDWGSVSCIVYELFSTYRHSKIFSDNIDVEGGERRLIDNLKIVL